MKTEARKAYEKQMPCGEMLIRKEIGKAKRGIKYNKWCLHQCEDALRSDYQFTPEDVECVKQRIARCLRAIKGYKQLVQNLKSGLPHRRPEGVMAKCPFCGAKASDVVFTMTSSDGEVMEFNALEALEDVHENKFIVGCRMCGAHIEQGIDDERTVQDVINEWNRSAR